jgi:hypothetical protein
VDSQQVIPEEVWDQDVAQGGVVDGDIPAKASAVVIEGVTWVRDAPALAATFGLQTVTQNTSARLVGRNGRRRRLLLSVRPNTIATAYVIVAENAQQAAGGYGLPILQGSPVVPLTYAGEIYIGAFGADVAVGFVAELDQG